MKDLSNPTNKLLTILHLTVVMDWRINWGGAWCRMNNLLTGCVPVWYSSGVNITKGLYAKAKSNTHLPIHKPAPERNQIIRGLRV